jgi:hypothetical protein
MGYKHTPLEIPGKSCGILLEANSGAGFDGPPKRPYCRPARNFPSGAYNFGTVRAPAATTFANN